MTQLAQDKDYAPKAGVLYMAIELSLKQWRLAFGDGVKERQKVIKALEVSELLKEIRLAKKRFELSEDSEVISCYEAGREGFSLHRFLIEHGIKNKVVDSSSIEVNRRSRRAKTDRIDAKKLLKQLVSYSKGEREKLTVLWIPTQIQEEERRLHRERDILLKERTRYTNRLKSLVYLDGVDYHKRGRKSWSLFVREAKDLLGNPLSERKQEEVLRLLERLELVQTQLKSLQAEMRRFLEEDNEVSEKIKVLKELKGIGEVGSWVLVKEWFSWRKFRNRGELGAAAGLTGCPYDSGESRRDQGISKAGNYRIRNLMIELSWLWLRYQKGSDLTKWFESRFGEGKRHRKVGIVALARRLLIDLWRYVEEGKIPAGADLKEL